MDQPGKETQSYRMIAQVWKKSSKEHESYHVKQGHWTSDFQPWIL